eukprot:2359479-Prymnesium_polylepis.1
MTSDESNDVCFALAESLAGGAVVRFNPPMGLIRAVVCKWIEAGGPEALRRANPTVIDHADDHWVTMPRSILKKFEGRDFGVAALGRCKLVTMHVRVFRVVLKDRAVPI